MPSEPRKKKSSKVLTEQPWTDSYDLSDLVTKIKNAGAIFIGHFTPEAVGDYIAGPNHVLPTNGTAKFSSGLGVVDFCKRTTIVEFNKENLHEIGQNVVTLAKAEGLDAHAMSVELRLNNKWSFMTKILTIFQ